VIGPVLDRLTLRAYRALLRLYPRSFRRAYGDEAERVLRDLLRDRRGTLGLPRLWGRVLGDMLSTATKERGAQMKTFDWLVLLAAVVLGLAIALVDVSPGWDDTGVSAGALFLGAAALGATRPSRAWLWGLAVGLWVPALNLVVKDNPGALLALVPALVGAFAGAGARRLLAGSDGAA
jgi:DMSO reductase anchor subunit